MLPKYTDEEILELGALGDNLSFHTFNTLTLVFRHGEEGLKNSIKTKLQIITEREKKLEEVSRGWANINDTNEKLDLMNIYKAIFCDSEELPILMGGPFSPIIKWRIAHGK